MKHVGYILCSIIWCFGTKTDGTLKLSLNGNDWKVVNQNGSIHVAARVPGSIYTDLANAGRLNDPYYRFNDVLYRWVAHSSWTYSKTFQVDNKLMQRHVVNLLVGGMDTVSTVAINGHIIGKTDNMFRRYIFPVKDVLKVGPNLISVEFESPIQYAADQAKAYPYDVPPDCPSPDQHGECHFNFIRKEASSFSWDWGPAFPTMGIWRNLTLEAFDEIAIRYVMLQTPKDASGGWSLRGRVYTDVGSHMKQVSATLTVTVPSNNITHKRSVMLSRDKNMTTFDIPIPKEAGIEAWWPNGHGSQPLYEVLVTITTDTDSDTKHVTTGFRTVELVQEPITGSSGLSFYFKINGQPIFMKGSNWIPADSFQERITPEYLENLISSAARANMNMMRVWGGGVYESETFYALADRYGIMLWQDFMFACAMYPSNMEFLSNARAEVTHQVRRLSHHPSIAIWAANNENEGRIFKGMKLYKQYLEDYVALYRDVVGAVVTAEDDSRPFVPSSPSDGVESIKEGYIAKNPQDTHYGDVHHYDYTSDGWNWQSYPLPRFASEFGFQAWCSFEALQSVSVPEDWSLTSNFTSHRQHHPNGNAQMLAELSQHLTPPPATDPTQHFKDYIYLNQINQAMAIKTEAELYRRLRDTIFQEQGHTMGSLYWQLNDIWQAPTWASIEYGGKWKMLHYFAQRFYNQTLLSPFTLDDDLIVFYVDDGILSRLSAAKDDTTLRYNTITHKLYIQVYGWDSLRPRLNVTHQFKVPPAEAVSTAVYQTSTTGLLKQAGCSSPHHCLVTMAMDEADTMATNFLLLSNFTTAVGLQKANVKVSAIVLLAARTLLLRVTTDQIAPFVWLEALKSPGHFSDNGFLLTTASRELYFHSWVDISDVRVFKQRLTVRSLMDVYQ